MLLPLLCCSCLYRPSSEWCYHDFIIVLHLHAAVLINGFLPHVVVVIRMYDLMFTYEHYIDQLPESFDEFRRNVRTMFPIVFDTKHFSAKKDLEAGVLLLFIFAFVIIRGIVILAPIIRTTTLPRPWETCSSS